MFDQHDSQHELLELLIERQSMQARLDHILLPIQKHFTLELAQERTSSMLNQSIKKQYGY